MFFKRSDDSFEENSDLKRKKVDSETESNDESSNLFEKTKHIPVRLLYEERKDLRILESALYISEYTSKIDILAYNKKGRIITQLTEICTYLSGLLLTSNYNLGQKLLSDKKIKENEEFFQHMFEIGRRHKIMNPEKMRSEYGKLVYLLQGNWTIFSHKKRFPNSRSSRRIRIHTF
jgi:hypothetical protein